jgi:hypothetical protein
VEEKQQGKVTTKLPQPSPLTKNNINEMVAKGRNKKTTKVVKAEVLSSDEDVDLDAMERMLNDSDSDANSDEEMNQGSEEEDESSEEEASDDHGLDDDIEQESDEDEDDDDDDDSTEGNEKCTIDLRNLLAFNTHQMNHKALYKKQPKSDDGETTIFVDGIKVANDDFLLQKSSECCTQLLAGLWKLETEKTDVGPLAILPSYFETITPRELVSTLLSSSQSLTFGSPISIHV